MTTPSSLGKHILQHPWAGNWIQVGFSIPGIFDNEGTLGGGTWEQSMFVVATIWNLGAAEFPDCDKGQPECILGAQLEPEGPSEAGPPITATLDSGSSSGSSIMIGTPCSSFFTSEYYGQYMAIDALELTLNM